ncbi:hypothetical protein ACU6YR_16415 [Klebsiella aerogenes]
MRVGHLASLRYATGPFFFTPNSIFPQGLFARLKTPFSDRLVSDSGSRLAKMILSFALKETLFYKSVTHVARPFVFLPLNDWYWQKRKGKPVFMILL